jgi:MarR family transcriptional regulator, 2-MHQ and catechol-resistance regulon repressor
MGTRYQGTVAEIMALNAYIKLMRAANSVTTRVHRHLTSVHLSLSQFAVLEALYHLGSLSQRDIGKKLLRSGGNITMVIDNLEARGLVTRARSKEDRRFITIELTEAGLQLIREVFPRHAQAILREMQSLTPEEQEELGLLCRKLGLQSAEEASTPSSRGVQR